MERFDYRAGEKDEGAITLVLDLAKLLSASGFQAFGPGRRTSIFPRRFCGCSAGTSSIRGACSLKGASRNRLGPSRRVFVDDMTASMQATSKEFPCIAEKVLKLICRLRKVPGREISGMHEDRRSGSCHLDVEENMRPEILICQ